VTLYLPVQLQQEVRSSFFAQFSIRSMFLWWIILKMFVDIVADGYFLREE
jgi:hypothetical protein